MAGKLKEVRTRITSVISTQQITKAMKMVSAAKLRRAQDRILQMRPYALKMGELLHDNTLDDNTNKMEGPISSLMQSIGSVFSKPVTGDEIKEQ